MCPLFEQAFKQSGEERKMHAPDQVADRVADDRTGDAGNGAPRQRGASSGWPYAARWWDDAADLPGTTTPMKIEAPERWKTRSNRAGGGNPSDPPP
jgi:hypothetical protein